MQFIQMLIFYFFVSGRFFRVVYKLAVTFQAMVLPKITHSEFPHRAPHNTSFRMYSYHLLINHISYLFNCLSH